MKVKIIVGILVLFAIGFLIASLCIYNRSEYKGYRANWNYYQEVLEELDGKINNSDAFTKVTINATKNAVQGALNNIKKNMEPYENKFHFLLYAGVLLLIIAGVVMIVVIIQRIRNKSMSNEGVI